MSALKPHHHHHHHHQTPANIPLADKNREFMNKEGTTMFTTDWVLEGHRQITTFLHQNTTWLNLNSSSPQEKMLDYACGNGVASRALKPYFRRFIGVDVSDAMVEAYKAETSRLGMVSDAVRGDLFAKEVDESLRSGELEGFDFVVISMALHHVEDAQLALSRLVERLRPGGVLLVIDKLKEEERVDEQGNPALETVAAEAFSREEMMRYVESAGCEGFDFRLFEEVTPMPYAKEGVMRLFGAIGKKVGGD